MSATADCKYYRHTTADCKDYRHTMYTKTFIMK